MPKQVYVIFAVEDLNRYLRKSERRSLAKICNKIRDHREYDGKVPDPVYQIKETNQSVDRALDNLEKEFDEGGF